MLAWFKRYKVEVLAASVVSAIVLAAVIVLAGLFGEMISCERACYRLGYPTSMSDYPACWCSNHETTIKAPDNAYGELGKYEEGAE